MSAGRGTVAVIPFKGFALAKQRLSPAFGPDARRELAEAMLRDVLETLETVTALAGMLVVTRDGDAASLARRHGASVLAEPFAAGLNGAIAIAARTLSTNEPGGMLVIPSDVPGTTRGEIVQLLSMQRDEDAAVSIVPSHDRRGTNALLLAPPTALSPSFGEDSFLLHAASARALGFVPRILTLPGLGLDLDTPSDCRTFLNAGHLGRTAACLERLLSESSLKAEAPTKRNMER